MGALEQVSQMKSQGFTESAIVKQLRDEGVSPKEINDALGQSQIKDAVYNPREESPLQQPPAPAPEGQTSEAPYVPKTQEIEQAQVPQQQEPYTPYPQEEYAPPQEMYQQETYDYPQENYSTDTIIDISEQVFTEKIKKIERQINKLTDTQAILQTQVEHSTERLKRIESFMDKLQVAILEKVGSYGRNLESIKKEMAMVEDSFSKIIPHAKRHTTRKKTTPTKTLKKK